MNVSEFQDVKYIGMCSMYVPEYLSQTRTVLNPRTPGCFLVKSSEMVSRNLIPTSLGRSHGIQKWEEPSYNISIHFNLVLSHYLGTFPDLIATTQHMLIYHLTSELHFQMNRATLKPGFFFTIHSSIMKLKSCTQVPTSVSTNEYNDKQMRQKNLSYLIINP